MNPAFRTTIWLIGNGGSFDDGAGGETYPLGITPGVTLRWSSQYSSTEATILYLGVGPPAIQSAILFDGTAGPAGGGIDGTVPASGANGIRIVGAANEGLVNIRAAGTNTSAPTIKRVTFDNSYRAIRIEENLTPPATGGGTLSPRIDTCAFTGGSGAQDSGLIWMEALPPGVGAPSSTIMPTIANCTFGVSSGSTGFLGAIVVFVNRTPSAIPPWTAVVAPSISNCIIDGLDPSTMTERFTYGISAQGSGGALFALTGVADFYPSVSGSVVMNCEVTGIRFWAQDLGMVGTPVLSATTVRNCGLTQMCATFPPSAGSDEGPGNGAASTTGDFTTLTPSISDCVFENNGCDGLGLYIRGGGLTMIDQEPEFSATIAGSVVRCVSRNNGDDGFELRARAFTLAQPNPLVSTAFNANRSHDNADTGIEILTIEESGAPGPMAPSITSTHTNELYYDNNAAEGMRIQAWLPLRGAGTLAPIAEWITCWSNGPIGISYTPATPGGGTATGTPALWNSIVGMHSFADIDPLFPVGGINFCNYASGPTGTLGRTNITPDFVGPPGSADFHLDSTVNNNCFVIDNGAENPGCPAPPCVPVAVPFDFDGPSNPRVLDNPSAMCSMPLADRGVDERP